MCKIELESAYISAHSSPKSLYINYFVLASLPGSGDRAMTFCLKVPGLFPAIAYYCFIKFIARSLCKIQLESANSSPKSLYINPLVLASLPGSGDCVMTSRLKVPGLIPGNSLLMFYKD